MGVMAKLSKSGVRGVAVKRVGGRGVKATGGASQVKYSDGRFIFGLPKGAEDGHSVTVAPLQLKVLKVSDALGGASKLADVLGVNRSQATRWASGEGVPQPMTQRMIDDLDYVTGRARQLWEEDVAALWLVSPNAFLDGATPLAVLQTRGLSEVADALDAAAAGAYA